MKNILTIFLLLSLSACNYFNKSKNHVDRCSKISDINLWLIDSTGCLGYRKIIGFKVDFNTLFKNANIRDVCNCLGSPDTILKSNSQKELIYYLSCDKFLVSNKIKKMIRDTTTTDIYVYNLDRSYIVFVHDSDGEYLNNRTVVP